MTGSHNPALCQPSPELFSSPVGRLCNGQLICLTRIAGRNIKLKQELLNDLCVLERSVANHIAGILYNGFLLGF